MMRLRLGYREGIASRLQRPESNPRDAGCRAAPGRWDDVRPFAAGAAVLIAAMAFASLLRPRTAYAGAGPALLAIAFGAVLGAALLALVALVTRAVARTDHGRISLRQAILAWRTMAIVVILFAGAAAGPHVVRLVGALVRGADDSKAAAQADFSRWQQTVAPISGAYISAIRKDVVFLRGLPRVPDRRLPAVLSNSTRALEHLRHALVDAEPRLPSSPKLKRLTASLEQGLVLGERAQRQFRLVAQRSLNGVRTAGGRHRLRRLRAHGLAELGRSQQAMVRFSLGANKLGAALFAQVP